MCIFEYNFHVEWAPQTVTCNFDFTVSQYWVPIVTLRCSNCERQRRLCLAIFGHFLLVKSAEIFVGWFCRPCPRLIDLFWVLRLSTESPDIWKRGPHRWCQGVQVVLPRELGGLGKAESPHKHFCTSHKKNGQKWPKQACAGVGSSVGHHGSSHGNWRKRARI